MIDNNTQIPETLPTPEAAPVANTAPPVEQPQEAPLNIEAELETSLDNLIPEMKEFAVTLFTPEVAMFMGAWLGPEVGDVVMKYSDASTVLMPFPREEAEKMLEDLPDNVRDNLLGFADTIPEDDTEDDTSSDVDSDLKATSKKEPL